MNKENTLIIIDWDDTLFPSSEMINELNNNNKLVFDMDFDKELFIEVKKNINNEFIDLIKLLKKLGTVIIVTSSRDNWVLNSSKEIFSMEAIDLLKSINIFYVNKILEIHNRNNVSVENKKSIVFDIIINEFMNMLDTKNNWIDIINPISYLYKDNKKKLINIVSVGDGYQESNAYFYITRKNMLKNYYNPNYDYSKDKQIIYKHIEYKKGPNYIELFKEYKKLKDSIYELIKNPETTYYEMIFNKYNMCNLVKKNIYNNIKISPKSLNTFNNRLNFI